MHWRFNVVVWWRLANFIPRLLLLIFNLVRLFGTCFCCVMGELQEAGCLFDFIHMLIIRLLGISDSMLYCNMGCIKMDHYFLVDLKIWWSRLGFFSLIISLIFSSRCSAFMIFFLRA